MTSCPVAVKASTLCTAKATTSGRPHPALALLSLRWEVPWRVPVFLICYHLSVFTRFSKQLCVCSPLQSLWAPAQLSLEDKVADCVPQVASPPIATCALHYCVSFFRPHLMPTHVELQWNLLTSQLSEALDTKRSLTSCKTAHPPYLVPHLSHVVLTKIVKNP